MTADDLESYLRGLGLEVTSLVGQRDQMPYTVICGFEIPHGALASRICDIGILRVDAVPYVVPSAIHTRPALVPMNPAQPLATQPSPIGDGWQYWSRRLDRPPSPRAIWTHILTVLCDPTWPTN
jgi:hypothetical protein